jgi:signal transduction histidine kinase
MNRLLQRQLRRSGLAGPEKPPSAEQWRELLERIDRSYTLADQDRYTLERSLDVSSGEMQQLYDDLRRSAESQLSLERDKLKESLAILNATLDAAVDGVLVIGVARDVLACNRRFGEIWGIPSSVLATRSDAQLLDAVLSTLVDPDEFLARVEQLYVEPEQRSREELTLKDGRILDRFSAPVLADGVPLGRVWFFRDITAARRMEDSLLQMNDDLERRVRERTLELESTNARVRQQIEERHRAERALRQAERNLQLAQKMEAVDRLAGGIAHDFNNMLAVVISCAGLLEPLLEGQAEALEEVEQIQYAGHRAAELTRKLLAFSRQQVLDPECVDMREVARNVESMLARVMGADVDLALCVPDRKCPVFIDRSQVEQVLVNLVVNARDAMPSGGRIVVTVRRVEGSDARQLASGSAASYVAIDVEDEGSGMDADTQARIFEPFFTKGTGLGLAMVYGIVHQSGGDVSVVSAPGEGTKLTVFLPEASADLTRRMRSGVPAARETTGTVLLVDDEPMVRAAVRRILVRAGFRVIEASGADEVRALDPRETLGIQVLVTDVAMPKTGGPALAAELRVQRPSLPVVFMSGHADEPALEASRATGVFLQKPFRPDQLLTAVRSVL